MKLSQTIKHYIEFVYDNQYHIEYYDNHILVYYTEFTDRISYDSINYFMSIDPQYLPIIRKEKLKRI